MSTTSNTPPSLPFDPRKQKLGKREPKGDRRTLLMASYLMRTSFPVAKDWTGKLDVPHLGMMLNDRLGDCTCAAMGHLEQVWSANNGTEVTVTDADVETAYEGACGYKPDDPDSDQGGVELDVLKYWRDTGIANRRITGFVALEPKNHDHMKMSIAEFGGAYLGIALPATAQGQSQWSVVPHSGSEGAPGSWGGHAVCAVAYDQHYITVITWGQLLKMTWQFADKYMDEAYAVLSPEWCGGGRSPSGFNIVELQNDLSKL